MTKQRSPLERAAGKLISAVQREWDAEVGEPGAVVSEEVMHNSHDLLAAAKSGSLEATLRGRSITEFLGVAWVKRHPSIGTAIKELEQQMVGAGHAQQVLQGPTSPPSAGPRP